MTKLSVFARNLLLWTLAFAVLWAPDSLQARDVVLKVGLRSLQASHLTLTVGPGGYRLFGGSARSLGELKDGQTLEISIAPGKQVRFQAGTLQGKASSLKLVPRQANSMLFLRSRRRSRHFQGTLEILESGGLLRPILHAELENYLTGVVPAEMPSTWGLEALKAQAILARTYTLVHLGRRHALYDLCDESHCQVYFGLDKVKNRTTRAVQETRSQILLSGGDLATIFYHSTCGGATVSANNVFQNGTPRHERVRKVLYDQSGSKVLCSLSPHFQWEYRLDKGRFEKFLGNLSPAIHKLGRILSVRIVERDESGRVELLELVGKNGKVQLTGHEFRMSFLKSFRGDTLKSTLFSFDLEEGEVVFRGRGFGHGVGLCQWGAQTLAGQGQTAKQILKHYFPTAVIGKIKEPGQ